MQPFRKRLLPLAAAGLLIEGFTIIAQLLIIAISGMGIDGLGAMYTGDISDISSMEALSAGGIGLPLLYLLVIAVAQMLKLYSYFLIGWHDMPIISAFKESFTAPLKNWAPFLVSFLVCLVGTIVVTIVLFLLVVIFAWIFPEQTLLLADTEQTLLHAGIVVGAIVFTVVVIALLYGVWYYSYKTVFGEQEPTPEQKAYPESQKAYQ
jgi:hypothetical protein